MKSTVLNHVVVGLLSGVLATGAMASSKARSHATDTKEADQAVASWRTEDVVRTAEYNNSLFDSYVGDAKSYATKHVDYVIAKETKEGAEKAKVAEAAHVKLTESRDKLTSAQAQIKRDIADKDREILKLDQKIGDLEDQVLAGGKPDPAKVAELTAKKKALDAELTVLKGQMAQVEPALVEHKRKLAVEQGKYDEHMKGLEQKLSKAGKDDLSLEGFKTGVDQMFAKMKETVFDAKTLLMDFNTLKLKNKLTDAELKYLKDRGIAELDNTLLGKYINDQIQRKISGVCETVRTCPNMPGVNINGGELQKKIEEMPTLEPKKAPAKKSGVVGSTT